MSAMQTIELPAPLVAQVKALAKELSSTPASIIEHAISAIAPSSDERDRQTRERMANLNAENSIPHETVVAWAKSLKKKR
jgi:predicted transcriptional regulator